MIDLYLGLKKRNGKTNVAISVVVFRKEVFFP